MEPDVAAAFAAQLEHNNVAAKTIDAIGELVKTVTALQEMVSALSERVKVLERKSGD